ncbi:GspE/PulE family protein [Gloeobacter kilaueensis]|uniref:General secretory pathway protein E n=1 Tax=Gloeobacter kilaueensis (strain ATCC BAA-2537 / CCAP 1431/1 / ULC 316 / JS1) TaxID=1183438 RepID=U5QLK6_GLOK1|nr:GspE/PulE family protein [Gloeobacter kilaueensis]AGY59796.1 general secretory pathway protein E [Gloeobacter kilaueensis JS1]
MQSSSLPPELKLPVADSPGIGVVLIPETLDWNLIRSLAGKLGEDLRSVVPLAFYNRQLYLGSFNVLSEMEQRRVREKISCDIRLVNLAASEVRRWWNIGRERLPEYFQAAAGSFETGSSEPTITIGSDGTAEGKRVSSQLQRLLNEALRSRASDIHLESQEDGLRVRFRIDGLLREMGVFPVAESKALISRVKVLAELDIANHRTPQDGRVTQEINGQLVDLRVSTLPCLHGEKAVLRLLPKNNTFTALEELGYSAADLARFRNWLGRAQGLVLITGPTGSGKTSTLYTSLREILRPESNIVTIEDPIEYQLPGINQVQVHPRAGLTFASGLRSILRQDPDIIMVGEIRDLETAQTVFQAAMTGHLVLSTLHTNDAPSAVSRLLDMQVEPYLIAGALLGVVAQRLVRRVCRHCGISYAPDSLDLQRLKLDSHPEYAQMPIEWKRASGCQHCFGSGYYGREGIFEVMEIDEHLRGLIHARSSNGEITSYLRARGIRSLPEAGVAKVMEGSTTIEELLRVVSV